MRGGFPSFDRRQADQAFEAGLKTGWRRTKNTAAPKARNPINQVLVSGTAATTGAKEVSTTCSPMPPTANVKTVIPFGDISNIAGKGPRPAHEKV
jgi:hypothetical protein